MHRLSNMELEYIACAKAVPKAVWLRRFLWSLGVIPHSTNLVHSL